MIGGTKMNCENMDSLYHVFLQVIRLHYQRTHVMLDKIGVYPGQPPMLFTLFHKDGQSQKELANKLKIQPATITVMLKRMEKAGLVERRQDKEDQRIWRVHITEEGRKICAEVNEILKDIDEEMFKNFADEEKILLRRLFMQMRDNLLEVSDT